MQSQVNSTQELVQQKCLRSVEGESMDDDAIVVAEFWRSDVEGDVASEFLVAEVRGSGIDEAEDGEDAELVGFTFR